MPRFHCPEPLAAGPLLLPPGAARHAQVLRLQPGDAITLFDGRGGQWQAVIERMGRSEVAVLVGAHQAVEREAPREVHLAVGIPANERMDWLVEKASELGAASVQPLLAERSVLKPNGERAAKKQAHWQAVAVAACEQCGRNRVPVVHAPAALEDWQPAAGGRRWLLSLADGAPGAATALSAPGPAWVLSGPEGGLTAQEEALALARGFERVSLGQRVLRAETAPLAMLALLTMGTA
ncbi:16S rRNA (uracil(1498)-N(3))-methyltransferase [Ramlibacter tataouinensis]|nr:16S rRNA (uracil(1498)-N(3))-methyltransferase [Ramlibacter tataouinensis]